MTHSTQNTASAVTSTRKNFTTYDYAEAILGPGIAPGEVHVASFGDSEAARWGGRRLANEVDNLDPDNNNFICMSPLAEGTKGREAKHVSEHTCLWMDDVGSAPGSKVSFDRVQSLISQYELMPTMIVETSPGNFSIFWRLETPVDVDSEDAGLVDTIRQRFKKDGWGDPASQDAAHYMRLPGGINGKEAYRQADGSPFRTRTVEFDPDRTVTLEAFAGAVLGSGWEDAVASSGPTDEADHPSKVDRTGWAAPSLDLLSMAMERLPNDPGGPFDDYSDWVAVGHAVKGAAMAAGIDAEARDIWLDWSAKNGGDPDKNAEFWGSCLRPRTGWGTLMLILERVNPTGYEEVTRAVVRAAFQNAPIDPIQLPMLLGMTAQTKAPLSLALSPVVPFNPHTIPPRQWLYGTTAIAGFLSMLVAPGGSGKSALAFSEAVAMASGRELLAGEKPVRPLRVWMHNAEDALDEMHRRLAAALQLHGLQVADLLGNLFLTSGRDLDLKIARQTRNGLEIDEALVEAIVEVAKAAKLDVIIFDPLGAMHTLPENSNEAANLLAGALRDIAHRSGCAVMLLHHASKVAAMDMDTAGVSASRGASAFTDAARDVRQLVRMTEREASAFGIAHGQHRSYFRVENGKANMAPAANARWIRTVGVPLHNGAGLWPLGDTVGAVERWHPPGPVVGTVSDLLRVQQAIAAASTRPRESNKSPDWIGYLVGSVLGLDIGPPSSTQHSRTPEQAGSRAKVTSMIQGWLESGGLCIVRDHDKASRKDTTFVEAGDPALPFEEDHDARAAGVVASDAQVA